jgi:hypothetical protein
MRSLRKSKVVITSFSKQQFRCNHILATCNLVHFIGGKSNTRTHQPIHIILFCFVIAAMTSVFYCKLDFVFDICYLTFIKCQESTTNFIIMDDIFAAISSCFNVGCFKGYILRFFGGYFFFNYFNFQYLI